MNSGNCRLAIILLLNNQDDWNAPETWLCNRVPKANDTVLIKPIRTIEVSKAIKRIKTLILRGNIKLQTNALPQYP